MARKYLCDNCGTVFDSLYKENGDTRNLFQVASASIGHDNEKRYYTPIIEVCGDCLAKIVARIKEVV